MYHGFYTVVSLIKYLRKIDIAVPTILAQPINGEFRPESEVGQGKRFMATINALSLISMGMEPADLIALVNSLPPKRGRSQIHADRHAAYRNRNRAKLRAKETTEKRRAQKRAYAQRRKNQALSTGDESP